MHTRNALHGLAIAVGQPAAIDMLEHPRVGGAIPCDGYIFFRWKWRRHGLIPDQLVTQVAGDKAMRLFQFLQQAFYRCMCTRDELKQRFGRSEERRVGKECRSRRLLCYTEREMIAM